MSAILIYSESHCFSEESDVSFEYLCPGFDMEIDALHYMIDNEEGFKIMTEKWSIEDDEEQLIEIRHIDGDVNWVYKLQFMYLDEPIFLKEITKR